MDTTGILQRVAGASEQKQLRQQPPKDLLNLFKSRICEQTGDLAYSFLRDDLASAESVTFGQLGEQVLQLVSHLSKRLHPGDRVILAYGPGIEPVRAFWACIVSGAIPVPAPSPDAIRLKNSLPRLRTIAADAGATLILTTSDILQAAHRVLSKDNFDLSNWIATDVLEKHVGDFLIPENVVSELAYLQYTSGSTASPRGVMISHANVLANCAALSASLKPDEHSRILSWLPYFHDYGLVYGVIWPLYTGIPAYLMSPITFLRRPLRWLEAVDRFGITHTGAPNFAFSTCVQALERAKHWNASLKSLKTALCGAEPINPKTIERFNSAFSAHGLSSSAFSPGYGLAEGTLASTIKPFGKLPTVLEISIDALEGGRAKPARSGDINSRALVGCGVPVADTKILVVDPVSLMPLKPGHVGEVWLSSPSNGLGYYQRPEATADTFKVSLPQHAGLTWLRTGDLGFLYKREIFITGRLKDLLIIHGRNYYPQDIEWTAERSAGGLRIGYNAAFSVDHDDGERLVVVQEVERSDEVKDLAAIAQSIRHAVAEDHNLPVYAIVLIRSGTIQRTSSGKIRRKDCKQDFLDGRLAVIHSDFRSEPFSSPSADSRLSNAPAVNSSESKLETANARIEATIVSLIALLAQCSENLISKDSSLIECGLDSIASFRFLQEIETSLNVSLPISHVLGGQSVREIAAAVGRMIDESSQQANQITSSAYPLLRPFPARGALPLSFAQQRIWILDQLGAGCAYNVPFVFRLKGRLDTFALQKGIEEIIHRHIALRTVFVPSKGEPKQIVNPAGKFILPIVDLRDMAQSDREDEVIRLAKLEASQPFDLAFGPLIRAKILQIDSTEYVFLITAHHIVFDGWSLGVFNRELAAAYKAFSLRQPSPLSCHLIQYDDFSQWQRQILQGGFLDSLLSYWRQKLEGLPVLEIATDRPRLAVTSFRGGQESKKFSHEFSSRLKEFCRSNNVTLLVPLLAAFSILLQRYSRQDDIAIGVPVASRTHKKLERLIGFFVNILVMRTKLSADSTALDFLRQVREMVLEAYAHQDLPFELLVENLQPRRDQRLNPLVQVLLAVQNVPVEPLELAGIEVSPCELQGVGTSWPPGVAQETARFDLELHILEEAGEFNASLVYNADLFDAATVARLLEHYQIVLESIVTRPNERLAQFSLITPTEHLLIKEWNSTSIAYPAARCIQELVEEQIRAKPHNLAVDDGFRKITYQELDEYAERVSVQLRARGAGTKSLIAIYLERSIEMLVGMLAVWKSGGAFVPIDPSYPAARVDFMLKDSKALVILTRQSLLENLSEFSVTPVVVNIEEASSGSSRTNRSDVGRSQAVDQPAYLIYTSGSTGSPKGVLVSHRSLFNLVHWHQRAYEVNDADRATQIAGSSFDASIWEAWPYLASGASLHIPDENTRLDPNALMRWLVERHITLTFLPTPLAEVVIREPWPESLALRVLLTGGDRLNQLPDKKLPFRLVNHYGPTENTVVSTYFEVQNAGVSSGVPPIGRPLPNTTAYVVDSNLQLVPLGVPGELLVGGVQVALGYWDRPNLTAEKFVPNRFGSDLGSLYRTGDLVRYRADGNIEFLGRIDDQVKIRGIRIELGEVMAGIARYPAVDAVTVRVHELVSGERCLVAYVVAPRPPEDLVDQLRAFLRGTMPEYMVPAAFVVLKAFPLSPNGKIDLSALPAPQENRLIDKSLAPRGELEQRIADIWRQVLGLDHVGIRENFFDLGGSSLLLVKVHALLSAQLDCSLKVVDLLAYPTIETLTNYLKDGSRSDIITKEHIPNVNGGDRHIGPEPIAIVGMSGRFPGAADIESFWENLRQGRESITFFTKDEMREAGVTESILSDQDYVGARGYLEDVDKFDAGFFGYSAREAELIDPQQRLLLECAVETLERAGCDPDRFSGSIGVYVGSGANDYSADGAGSKDLPGSPGVLSKVLGKGRDFLATRISYKLNLRGPSINVQTACSTSLVAVHQACRALQNNECDMALAGGVAIALPLKSGHIYTQEGIGSQDGHCRAFDAGANGTVGGNGAALVLLKRLSDAVLAGDSIHAVIRGIAINNDGSSKVGFTAPSVEGQAKAIARAYAEAQFNPDTVDYVEAHGTGTLLGDPVEIAALTQVLGSSPRRSSPRWIGSVKTNVGHLDAASGVTGLIKAALSISKKAIVPSLNFKRANPRIDFDSASFKVNTELRNWEVPTGQLRRAGVSSFGLGGTNVHALLEEAPSEALSELSNESQILCLSAKSANSLERAAAKLARHIRESIDFNLADAAYTLQVGRREYPYRRTVICSDSSDAVELLSHSASETSAAEVRGGGANRPIVFMFSGQGAQYPNMGLDLYKTKPVFRDTLDNCCEKLKRILNRDLREVLFPADSNLEFAKEQLKRTELTQPALFVVEYSMAELLRSLGVQPSAMIGHSIGEYVAACIAEVFSVDDALELVAERGRLIAQLPLGAMLAVPLSQKKIEPLLGEGLSIACVNSPMSCVVSGPEKEIGDLQAQLASMEIESQRLHTSHAFHSSMMSPILEPFTQKIRDIKFGAPKLPYLSNVTGDWITPEQATDPAYYASHLRHTVQFSKGLEHLLADQEKIFIEVGPGNTLTGLAKGNPARKSEQLFLATMRHGNQATMDGAVFLESIGKLWLAGVSLSWPALHVKNRRRRIVLPTYCFEKTRYWIGSDPLERQLDESSKQSNPEDWFYEASWRRTALAPTAKNLCSESWLIFADQHGLGTQLTLELARCGARIVCVMAGECFADKGNGAYEVNPGVREDYDALIRELKRTAFIPDFIVHLWSIDPDEKLKYEPVLPADYEDRGFFSIVFLIQALLANGIDTPLGLAVLTTQAQEVTGNETIVPEKAMALAPCKVVGMEHPHIRARSIDLILESDLQSLGRILINDLRAPWDEPTVAYRGRFRWVQRFENVKLELGNSRIAKPSGRGTYLIAGGLGDLGLEIAEHFARTEKANLALVSRAGLPPREQWEEWLGEHNAHDTVSRRIQRIKKIEAFGAQVLICKADVTDVNEMAAAITETERTLGTVTGVMYLAGAEKRSLPIQLLQRSDCEQQLRVKLCGLRVLEKVVDGMPLEFCLVHSSLASVAGAMGFVDYTASHMFMDAFVCRRNRRSDRSWKLVNWDNWITDAGETGSTTRPKVRFYLTAQEGTDALSALLSTHDTTQILVSTGQLQERIDRWKLSSVTQGNEQGRGGISVPNAHPRPHLSVIYAEPRNDFERLLTEIWKDVLGLDQVGIHDNFFELGGDSVLNIQIAARARKDGIDLTPKHIFEYQTIAELIAATRTSAIVATEAEQGVVTGAVPLLPIQHWFFGLGMPHPEHFNLPVMVEVKRPLDFYALCKAVEELVRHHDALRLSYSKVGDTWTQQLKGLVGKVPVRKISLAALEVSEHERHLRAIESELQQGLNLIDGPLFQIGYIERGTERSGLLLLVAHHLLVDAVSWRVLLEDLSQIYEAISEGKRLSLPRKSTSIKRWSEDLAEYARNHALEVEVEFWKVAVTKPAKGIPVDFDAGANTVGSSVTISKDLSDIETRALLADMPRIYKAQVEDALLLALLRAVCAWTGGNSMLVNLEGDGRDEIQPHLDVSRTVGWFTTIYPMRLELSVDSEWDKQIDSVKAQLQMIPRHGAGFGLLRYLNKRQEVAEILKQLPIPEISFLYLGRFHQGSSSNLFSDPAFGAMELSRDPGGDRPHLLEVNSMMIDGRLRVSWTYSSNRHQKSTIDALAETYMENIRLLIESCVQADQEKSHFTKFDKNGIGRSDLRAIAQQLLLQGE